MPSFVCVCSTDPHHCCCWMMMPNIVWLWCSSHIWKNKIFLSDFSLSSSLNDKKCFGKKKKNRMEKFRNKKKTWLFLKQKIRSFHPWWSMSYIIVWIVVRACKIDPKTWHEIFIEYTRIVIHWNFFYGKNFVINSCFKKEKNYLFKIDPGFGWCFSEKKNGQIIIIIIIIDWLWLMIGIFLFSFYSGFSIFNILLHHGLNQTFLLLLLMAVNQLYIYNFRLNNNVVSG